MQNLIIETDYPLEFRKEDSKTLGEHLKNRHSISLIGMKRVGISNFLRFFLYKKGVVEKFIGDGNFHLFITVDLNDLVEREVFPFWILTLKRIEDAVNAFDVSKELKKEISDLFVTAIQSKDLFSDGKQSHGLFLLIDSIRKAINKIVQTGVLPTIFFIRFDRIGDSATKELLFNLEGLREATHHKLSYVFTTYRRLDQLMPKAFDTTSLNLASNTMHLKTAVKSDSEIIAQAYISRYDLKLSKDVQEALFDLVNGYNQYLQLALILLNEHKDKTFKKEELLNLLTSDERVILQSEELWESLEESEKDLLLKVSENGVISEKESSEHKYLWDTGFLKGDAKNPQIFSPIFKHFLSSAQKKPEQKEEVVNVDFSKKEHLLFSYLQSNLNEICERESIIASVWPEEEALGVSDWAIDRLVARVRSKLKQKNNQYEIVTVKTRGYKLIASTV
jgi:DNA-binding winged helix-turn-helix (wHTH) protein